MFDLDACVDFDEIKPVILVDDKFDGAGKRGIGLVRHHAADGAELGFALLVLSHANGRKQRETHRQTANAPPHVHLLPPAAGSIWNTILSSLPPVFASIVRVCSAKPFART